MDLLPVGVPAMTTLLFIFAALVLTEARNYPRAYSYGTIALIVFFGQSFSALFFGGDPVSAQLAVDVDDLLAFKVWWTPLSYMFLHLDFLHLFGNIFILLSIGPLLESRIGARRFAAIFFAAGVIVPAVTAVLAVVTAESIFSAPAVGASGAVFGVLATFATLYPNERVPVILLFFVVWLPAQIVFSMYIAFNLIYALGSTSIGWWGHFAGAAVGIAAVPLLNRYRKAGSAPAVEINPSDLEPLATTPTLKSILGHLRDVSKNETRDDAVFRAAWLERFIERAKCPKCGKTLELGAGGITSDCGYSLPDKGKAAPDSV
ncbi:MAG: rhomboid family intramembrane serine protease [Euryarchaeota archaeon]|nr:rhomboid family intramembrane serine protease [Euryarchaeota archaeon]